MVRLGAPDLLRRLSAPARRDRRGALQRARPFPSNAALAASALATGAVAFLLRLRWPTGREAIGLQIGYFASYVVLFAAGRLGAKGAGSKGAGQPIGHMAQDLHHRRRGAARSADRRLVIAGRERIAERRLERPCRLLCLLEPFFAWGATPRLAGTSSSAISPRSARFGAIWRDAPISSTSSTRRSWSASRFRCAASPPPRW